MQTLGLSDRSAHHCTRHRVPGWPAKWISILAAVVVLSAQGMAPAHANGFGAWIVADLSGEVSVRSGDTSWRGANRGQALVPGTTLRTGTNGRATITRNGDVIEVSPISVVALPVGSAGAPATGVVQSLGTLLYKILTRERKQARFSVKTPYLAAVIKGTTFTVSVNDQGSALHVTEGIVQVTSPFTRETALIKPGQTGTVSASGNRGLKVRRAGQKRSSTDTDGTAKTVAKADPADRDSSAEKGKGGKSRPEEKAAGDKRGPKIGKRLGAPRIDIGAVTGGLIESAKPPVNLASAGPTKATKKGKSEAKTNKELAKSFVPGISSGEVTVAGLPASSANGTGSSGKGGKGNGSKGAKGPKGHAHGHHKNGKGKGKGKGKKK